jgi:DNA-binding NtrC family response regulator
MREILIIEDEAIIRASLNRLLSRNGYRVAEAESLEQAEADHPLANFDLILSDLRLPGAAGTEVIARAEGVPVVIMTSYASVRSAVEAMRLGAVDYIAKPFDHDEMLLTIGRAIKQRDLERQNVALKSDLSHCYPVAGMIGNSPPMREVFARIARIAPTDATVLVLGESGTGKELVARALHHQSPRRDAPLITVNCAAIADSLIESELFGHEKGAFTGATGSHRGLVEAAHGGTLFLDEIGELTLDTQARLLRVLQEGEIRRVGATRPRRVDLRLIAATHRDLQQRVRDGAFREDLYFRLHVMEIPLPPLRLRGNDIEILATQLLQHSCQRLNRQPMSFSEAARTRMQHYPWPGNVRELQNAIERAVILTDGEVIDADQLLPGSQHDSTHGDSATPSLSLDQYFISFVQENEGQLNETELARQLGISRKTLWERRQKLGIPKRR